MEQWNSMTEELRQMMKLRLLKKELRVSSLRPPGRNAVQNDRKLKDDMQGTPVLAVESQEQLDDTPNILMTSLDVQSEDEDDYQDYWNEDDED